MISIVSVLNGLLFLTLFLAVMLLLGKNKSFLAACGVKILPLAAVLAPVRVLLPANAGCAYVVESRTILPAARDLLETPVAERVPLGAVLGLLWAAGAAVALAVSLVRCLRVRRRARGFRRAADERFSAAAAELGIPEDLVRLTPDVSIPVVVGWFRPRIYFPVSDLTDGELRYALRHEWQHVRNRDNLLKLFYMVFGAALWFHPLVYLFLRRLDDILEYRCDQAVLRGSGEAERLGYTEALLRITKAARDAERPRLPAGVSGFAGERPGEVLLTRAKLILYGRQKPAAVLLGGLVCLAAFVASYFVVWQPAGPANTPRAANVVMDATRDETGNTTTTTTTTVVVSAFSLEDGSGIDADDVWQYCETYELWFRDIYITTYSSQEDADAAMYRLADILAEEKAAHPEEDIPASFLSRLESWNWAVTTTE